jgi:hypothetical protein
VRPSARSGSTTAVAGRRAAAGRGPAPAASGAGRRRPTRSPASRRAAPGRPGRRGRESRRTRAYALQQRRGGPGRVPGTDVAGAALPVDHRDDAASVSTGTTSWARPAEGGLGVEFPGELGAHPAEQRRVRAGGGPPSSASRRVGGVEDVDGQPRRARPDRASTHRSGRRGAPSRRSSAGRWPRTPGTSPRCRCRTGAGKASHSDSPTTSARGAVHQPLGLGVDVAEAPLGVEEAEGGRHRLEEAHEVSAVALPAGPGRARDRGRSRTLRAPTSGRPRWWPRCWSVVPAGRHRPSTTRRLCRFAGSIAKEAANGPDRCHPADRVIFPHDRCATSRGRRS